MSWDKLADSIQNLSRDICENEKVEKFASGVAPTIVGAVTGAATGNPVVGQAAAAVTGGFAKSESKAVAEVVVGTVITAAAAAFSIVAFPVFLGAAILSIFKSDS